MADHMVVHLVVQWAVHLVDQKAAQLVDPITVRLADLTVDQLVGQMGRYGRWNTFWSE